MDTTTREDLMIKCIHFDQDCFYDLRMVAAEQRQKIWVNDCLPDMASAPKDNYRLPDAISGGQQFMSQQEIKQIDNVSHEIIQNLRIKSMELLGSTQDGLYLEKGFPVIDNDTSELNASDIDILYEYAGIKVLDSHTSETACQTHLCLENTRYPGYFKMKMCHPLYQQDQPVYFKNLYLKLKLFKDLEHAKFYLSRNKLDETRDMAALLTNIDDDLGIHEIDNVAAFRFYKWPEVAKEFLTRYRPSNWPSKELIEAATSNGCGFIAKGRDCIDLQYQWRISFAASEKILSRSLKPCQVRAYLFMKSLAKYSLKKPKGLSSYMLKNVLFWTVETLDPNVWTEENLLYCVEALVFTLSEFLGNKIIPSYFLPSINLVSQLSHFDVHDLASAARRLHSNLFETIVKCTEWKKFKGHSEISLSSLITQDLDANEFESLCSMAYFSLYLYLRLQTMRYKMKLSTETLSLAFSKGCRSVCSKLALRAAHCLVEALKHQPDPELYRIETSPHGQMILCLDGMRSKVVDFWRSPVYIGIFSKMKGDNIQQFERFFGSVVADISFFLTSHEEQCQAFLGCPSDFQQFFRENPNLQQD